MAKTVPTERRTRTVLPHRRRLLLALLQAFGGRLPNRDFQKYLMLHEFDFAAVPSYDFVPYKYGGFSFQSYADRRSLVASGFLADTDEWQLAVDEDYLGFLDPVLRQSVTALRIKYAKLKGRDLVREVYQRYPYYAIRSEIAADILTKRELLAVEHSRPVDSTECLFTIGYEGKSLDAYLDRLLRNNVRVLCDVRRNPLSRKYGFSKSTLRDSIENLGMHYVHMPELGISSDKRQALNTPRDYERLFAHYERTTLRRSPDAVNHVRALIAAHGRVALTCFEADVCMCHRGRIAKALAALPEPPAAIQHL